NIWFRVSRRRLARALDLFHRAHVGNAGRRRSLPPGSPGRRSILCKAASCQQQALHIPPRISNSTGLGCLSPGGPHVSCAHQFAWRVEMKLILAVLCALTASSVTAQTAMQGQPTTDAEKIADAL